jgi:hypothetical protein
MIAGIVAGWLKQYEDLTPQITVHTSASLEFTATHLAAGKSEYLGTPFGTFVAVHNGSAANYVDVGADPEADWGNQTSNLPNIGDSFTSIAWSPAEELFLVAPGLNLAEETCYTTETGNTYAVVATPLDGSTNVFVPTNIVYSLYLTQFLVKGFFDGGAAHAVYRTTTGGAWTEFSTAHTITLIYNACDGTDKILANISGEGLCVLSLTSDIAIPVIITELSEDPVLLGGPSVAASAWNFSTQTGLLILFQSDEYYMVKYSLATVSEEEIPFPYYYSFEHIPELSGVLGAMSATNFVTNFAFLTGEHFIWTPGPVTTTNYFEHTVTDSDWRSISWSPEAQMLCAVSASENPFTALMIKPFGGIS